MHKGQNLASRAGSAHPAAQGHAGVDKARQAEANHQRADQQQATVGDQVRVIGLTFMRSRSCDTRLTERVSVLVVKTTPDTVIVPASGAFHAVARPASAVVNRWIKA